MLYNSIGNGQIVYSVFCGRENIENAIKIAGSCLAIITTLIALPKILITYLFPADEQKSIANLIQVLQKNDLETKSLIHSSELKCMDCQRKGKKPYREEDTRDRPRHNDKYPYKDQNKAP